MYSVVLMMALTTGGGESMSRHHGGSCCGAVASCGCEGGGRHRLFGGRHRGGCCGEAATCGGCAAPAVRVCGGPAPCASCGAAYAAPAGCSSCASGACAYAAPETGAATIVVSLPADAKLTIDGQATTSTSEHRVFVSPSLPAGQEYHYTLQAEVVVDGKPVTLSKTIAVRAGEQSQVTLAPITGVAAR